MKELTRAEYLRYLATPKPRYRTMRLERGRIRLGGRLTPPTFWFTRDDVGEMDGRYLKIRSLATVVLVVDGKPSVLFYLNGAALESCTFAYSLRPDELVKAATAMKRAGLGRLIVPAAEWAIREMPDSRRSTLEGPLRKLVRSTRKR
jgi:hypothetical protein